MSRLSQLVRTSLRRYGLLKDASPVQAPGLVDGFDTTISDDHLFEECRRLGLTPVLPVTPGFRRRSLGVQAVGADGAVSWVKISALRGVATHRLREAELAAARIEGVSKPALKSKRAWSEGDRHWLALQMAMAPSPPVEPALFAGAAAARIEAPWIASLKQAVDAVGRLKPDRSSITANEIRDLIRGRFGQVRCEVDEWRCAHGDLHWSNVTHPQIVLLDWEQWGLAPRGYDAAHLVVFSCTVPDLVRKLEDAFAADLDTASGRIAWLAILARRLTELDLGILDAAYRPHLDAMAKRVLARHS
jgi:hypothetical protein